MEEDIKILEELININKKDLIHETVFHKRIQAIEHLIARNKELEEKYSDLYKDNMKQWEERCRMAIELDNEVILKSKVRELKENIHYLLDNNGIARGYQIEIDRLFEKLLED